MNEAKRFKVLFSGSFTGDLKREQVVENLASLFKTTTEKVSRFLSGEAIVLKENQDERTARLYQEAIQRAGAVCHIVLEAETETENRTLPGPVTGDSSTSQGGSRTMASPEVAYAPVPANNITACPGGISFNRLDIPCTPFQDIALVAVFSQQPGNQIRILFFRYGRDRPIIGEGQRVAFEAFPGVPENNLLGSLRNLIRYFLSQNPSIRLDRPTRGFLEGKPPFSLPGKVEVLSAALAKALREDPPPPAPKPEHNIPGSGPPPHIAPFRVNPLDQVASAPDEETETDFSGNDIRADRALEDLKVWLRKGAFLLGLMLIGGFLMPLLKWSVLFDSSVAVWPWQVMGIGVDSAKTAGAMGTLSDGQYAWIWGMLPLISGCAVLIGGGRLNPYGLAIVMISIGISMMVLLLVVFFEEAEILGWMFVPPTAGGGVMMLIIILSGISVAAANHLQKAYDNNGFIRMLSGVGGLLLAAGMVLQILAADDAWKGWSMILVYLFMILYGIMGITGAILAEPGEAKTSITSALLRVILWWTPFACLIAQKWSSSEFVSYVVGGGGGIPQLVTSVVKGFLIYYGSAFLMALGLCALFELELINKKGD